MAHPRGLAARYDCLAVSSEQAFRRGNSSDLSLASMTAASAPAAAQDVPMRAKEGLGAKLKEARQDTYWRLLTTVHELA